MFTNTITVKSMNFVSDALSYRQQHVNANDKFSQSFLSLLSIRHLLLY